jgi:hypothetical protein
MGDVRVRERGLDFNGKSHEENFAFSVCGKNEHPQINNE